MKYFKYTLFTLLRLPAAWICGVRLIHLDDQGATASIKHRWINQNPYSSMFWAVQGMAAEFPTGILFDKRDKSIRKKHLHVGFEQQSDFYKKATGRINFHCDQGEEAQNAIKTLIETGEPQTIWLHSKRDESTRSNGFQVFF